MQELMCPHAAGKSQVFFVQFLNCRIVVSLAHEFFTVAVIKCLGSFFFEINPIAYIGNLQRLALHR